MGSPPCSASRYASHFVEICRNCSEDTLAYDDQIPSPRTKFAAGSLELGSRQLAEIMCSRDARDALRAATVGRNSALRLPPPLLRRMVARASASDQIDPTALSYNSTVTTHKTIAGLSFS